MPFTVPGTSRKLPPTDSRRAFRLGRVAEQAISLEELRESITRRYDDLTRSLDEQLGVEPARETRLVCRQLLGQA